MCFTERLWRVVERIHLAYLGLLPALATFVLLSAYGHPAMFLVFLGGIAAVGVYLAVVIGYTRPAGSLAAALFTLLDGPLFALQAWWTGGDAASPLIDGFLVDGIAIWLAIVWLAVATSRPTRGQRAATLFFALAAVGAMLSLSWPYLRESAAGRWARPLWLAVGIVEALVARHVLLRADRVVRDVGTSARCVVVGLFAWIAALIAGNVLYEVAG